MLALLMVADLVVGVPAGVVWIVVHGRRREAACRRAVERYRHTEPDRMPDLYAEAFAVARVLADARL